MGDLARDRGELLSDQRRHRVPGAFGRPATKRDRLVWLAAPVLLPGTSCNVVGFFDAPPKWLAELLTERGVAP